jgi:hypothetical protein
MGKLGEEIIMNTKSGDDRRSAATDRYAGCAWLHRRGKSTWMFEPNAKYGELVHVTRNGGVYAIIAGHKYGKPFWIGKLINDSWCTVENHLRSREIEFEDGGRYVFPS